MNIKTLLIFSIICASTLAYRQNYRQARNCDDDYEISRSVEDNSRVVYIPGPAGPPGKKGDAGPRGLRGAAGKAGAPGLQGKEGERGQAGINGTQGSTGIQGPKGDTGAQGFQGIQGIAGINGTDGKPGSPGRDGINGTKGETGATGPPGSVKSQCSAPNNVKFALSHLTTGRYLKNGCHKRIKATLDQARQLCRDDGMELFQIENADVQNALFDLYQKKFGDNPLAGRIDGVRASDGKWYYEAYGKIPVFSDLSWFATSNTPAGHDSMLLTNFNHPDQSAKIGSFKIDGYRKNDDGSGFFCQYAPVDALPASAPTAATTATTTATTTVSTTEAPATEAPATEAPA